MVDVLVRDLEEPVVARLRLVARQRQTTVEAVAASILRDAMAGQSRNSLLDRADAIAALTPTGICQTDSADLVREDRDQ